MIAKDANYLLDNDREEKEKGGMPINNIHIYFNNHFFVFSLILQT